jgi:hypothetical protein
MANLTLDDLELFQTITSAPPASKNCLVTFNMLKIRINVNEFLPKSPHPMLWGGIESQAR